jgi:molybdopterin molybdotransferase
MNQPPKTGFFDVRMRGFRDRTELAEAQALLDVRLERLASETIAATHAFGRVLATEIRSDVAVPAFDRAAMDGYALRAQETFGAGSYSPIELSVVGESLPARPYAGEIRAGQAVRIMTGAPMPQGTDAVLPAEAAQESNNVLRVFEPVPPLRHVGRCGEDVSVGQAVLPAGRLLRPQDLGMLASIGAAQVSVVRRPGVSILVTGDELLPAGSRPEGFRIVDSNSPMLAALVRRDGGVVEQITLIPDQRDLIREAMINSPGDVLLIAGGSSVGKEDHAPGLLAELGELPIHGLALRPASPTGIGFLNQRVVFLLPGNPVSCLCAYDLLAGRAVRRLGGRSVEMPYRQVKLPLAEKIVSAVGRVDYVRVKVVDGRAEPIAVSGASILSTTTAADGFVLVPRDLEGYRPCKEVDVYLYDG